MRLIIEATPIYNLDDANILFVNFLHLLLEINEPFVFPS
jgi:hypothetical protein